MIYNNEIVVKDLSIKFGKHWALKKINLTISNPSFVSIIGPNGGGKSTFLKSLIGLINPTEGSIEVFGSKPEKLSKSLVGYVPQIKTLDRTFPAKPIELVATGLLGYWPKYLTNDIKSQCSSALDMVGAQHIESRQLSELSGGELQRVYLARSFIRKPKILFLDEPATGIDIAAEKDLNKIIEDYKIQKEATIVMVTHDWEAAYHHADLVLMLNCQQICFDKPDIAFTEYNMRKVFGHVGHSHDMMFGAGKDA